VNAISVPSFLKRSKQLSLQWKMEKQAVAFKPAEGATAGNSLQWVYGFGGVKREKRNMHAKLKEKAIA
jgi:hypothetical protein